MCLLANSLLNFIRFLDAEVYGSAVEYHLSMGIDEDADALAYSRRDVPIPPSFAMPLGGAGEGHARDHVRMEKA